MIWLALLVAAATILALIFHAILTRPCPQCAARRTSPYEQAVAATGIDPRRQS